MKTAHLQKAAVGVIGHAVELHRALQRSVKGHGVEHRAVAVYRGDGTVLLPTGLHGVVDVQLLGRALKS